MNIAGWRVLFTAADDFILLDLVARAVEALSANPQAALFCSQVALIGRQRRMVGVRPVIPPRYRSGYLSPTEVRREIRLTDSSVRASSIGVKLWRRSAISTNRWARCATIWQPVCWRFRHGFYFAVEVLAVWTVDSTRLSAKSSLSVTESRRVLDVGRRWITAQSDVRDTYREMFDRRLRFNMARH
jgi:hypothetical protein